MRKYLRRQRANAFKSPIDDANEDFWNARLEHLFIWICIEYVVIRQSILIILQIIVVSGVMVEVWTELEAGPHSNSFYQGLMWTYGIEPFYISGTNPHRWEALLQLNVDRDDSMIWDLGSDFAGRLLSHSGPAALGSLQPERATSRWVIDMVML